MYSLGPLVDSWASAVEAARVDKETFTKTSEICESFVAGSVGGMWDRGFLNKHLAGMPLPKFQITINKASELVQLFGPTLMWNNPGRTAVGYEKLEIPPEFWGSPEDPQAQQTGMAWLSEYEQELARSTTRNAFMSHYLNYSPREQPGGGLRHESQVAIIDALVKGRGCIRVDAYQPMGSEGELTGGFYVDVDDLFIDPDSRRANLSDAKWIAVRHCEPHWVVEKRFGWPDGSLKGDASMTSKKGAQDAKSDFKKGFYTSMSRTNDLVVWFEVWSKCGVGTRFKGSPARQMHQAFEQSVGDYAYLCFIKGKRELLNVRNEFLEVADAEQVRQAFDWPIPYYMDGRWPIAMLDFWAKPNSPWPIATLSTGLGELICLNIFVSSLTDRIFQDGLVKAAVKDELSTDAIQKILSYQHEVIALNPSLAGNINEMVSYLQRPSTNMDSFRIIEYLSTMFDKRVGLTELMYGLSAKVSRTAADANIKGQAVSVRPEFMASQVTAWQTEIANLERIAAGYSVSGQMLVPLLGNMGSQLWDELITQADPVVYMREMRSRVEADSIRRPNKSQETENVTRMSQFMLPVAQWYAGSTGDVEPLNGLIKSIGKSIEMNVDDWLLNPIQQQGPSEEELAAQAEAAELMKAEKNASISNKQMKNAKMAHDLMSQGAGIPVEQLAAESEMEEMGDMEGMDGMDMGMEGMNV